MMEQDQQAPVKVKSKEQQFVQFIIERCNQDKGFAARLRRADNPATEYQSWEILGPWVDLEDRYQRLPYATIAAAIGRSSPRPWGCFPTRVHWGVILVVFPTPVGVFLVRDPGSGTA